MMSYSAGFILFLPVVLFELIFPVSIIAKGFNPTQTISHSKTNKMNSNKKTARLAGLLYLILAITGAYGAMYVPSKIMVRGDAVATANNILANEFLFRSGIASIIISQVIFVLLAFALYRLLKQVNEN